MQNSTVSRPPSSASPNTSDNVYQLSANGVTYQVVLPHASVDYIQGKMAKGQVPYELPMLDDMRLRLAPDDLVIDAGANIGNHTLYLAAVIGCRVAAFEPNPDLADALRRSLELNDLQAKVEIKELALGKSAGRGHFAKAIPDNLGAQSVAAGEGPLHIESLDSMAFPGPIKALKIDVEGMELDVLEGASQLVARDRPIIYVECADPGSFRLVHHWMTGTNYGYWDTFNATPTHLFLPNEQTSLDERLSRLQLKAAQDIYQLQEQISTTRATLDAANLKYRAAGEQITSLKLQLAEQEAARRAAELACTGGQEQLASTRERLEKERASLQQEVLRLSAQAESHQNIAHDAEKQLIRIEAALVVANAKASEAQERAEQARAEQERHAKLATELSDKLEATATQLAATRDSLHEANRKYRLVTEQVQESKNRAAQEDAMTRLSAEMSVKNTTQLIDTQTQLLEERNALLAEIANLRQEWQSATRAAHTAEKEQVRIESRWENARDALSKASDELLAERKTAQQRVVGLQDDLQRTQQLAKVTEQQLLLAEAAANVAKENASSEQARLQAERDALVGERNRLMDERDTLRSHRDLLASERDTLHTENVSLHGENDTLRAERVSLHGERDTLEAANATLLNERDVLQSERLTLQSEYHVLQMQRDTVQAEHEALLGERSALVGERDTLYDERNRLIDELDELKAERASLHSEISTLEAALAEAKVAVLRLEERQLVNEDQWLAEIASLSSARNSLEAELSGIRVELERAVDAERNAERTKCQAELELHEHRLLLTERSDQLEQLRPVRQQLDEVSERLAETGERVLVLERDLHLAQAHTAQAEGQFQEAQIAIAALEDRILLEEQAANAAQLLWAESQAELEDLRNELRAVRENGSLANAQIDQLQIQQKNSENHVLDMSRQLREAALKYRHVEEEEIPRLQGQLKDSQGEVQVQKHVVLQLQDELAKHKKNLTDANLQLERARQKTMQAEQQIIKTRASLSFQLGYILINGVKSMRGFMALPSALYGWRNEALRRRKKKAERMRKLEARPAIAQTPPIAPRAPETQATKPGATAAESAPLLPQVPPASPTTVSERAPANVSAAAAAADTAAPIQPVRDLRQLKVACIMDEFTFGSYRAECELYQLTPLNWEAELTACTPELLFVESAWRGKDELWGNKVGHTSQELQGIVAWCRQRGVPTIFWNKEDTVHFETFLNTAMLFDRVFTTDIDCIHRYKAALKHDQVFLLPFACQPNNNHPIETFDRKDAFCFAGAYYVRYPDRTRDLGNFIGELPAFRPVEIYDRNFGKNDPNYQFPPEYQPYIVGTLPFDQIDKAYKGYRYAINLNSIKQSQTMFARRVFELMASNTITVSNFSRGIRMMFGDLVVTTDSGHEVVRHLEAVAGDAVRSAKLRLAALRKVLQEHTYEHRLAYVYSKVANQPPVLRRPRFVVLASAENQAQLDYVLANVVRQHYHQWQLIVVLASQFTPAMAARDGIRFMQHVEAAHMTIAAVAGDADFLVAMPAQDYYGPHYLHDLALATTYSTAEVLGKIAQYAWDGHQPVLNMADASYRSATRFALRSAAVRVALVEGANLADCADAITAATLDTEDGLAIDEFNYCRDGHTVENLSEVQAVVDDLTGLDTGISIDELMRQAEQIPPAEAGAEGGRSLSGKQLAAAFTKQPSQALKVELDGDHWWFQSSLADGSHEYMYATEDWKLDVFSWTNKAEFYLDTTPGLNIQLVLVFLDAQKQKISHVIKHPNRNQEADIPVGTVSVRLGIRLYAGGSAVIQSLVLGHRNLQPAEIIGTAEHLIVTNHYPTYEDLYRNGFVHSRVMAYREHGVRCDVFRMRPNEPVSYHEFENIDAITGPQEALHEMLLSGRYKTVMVHFLEKSMWQVLQQHLDKVKVIIWIHGAEIQPWERRAFNYVTDDERTVAKMKSDTRMAFWRGLLEPMPANVRLVFVSRHFAEEVMQDLGFRIPEEQYSIIHNPIDTDIFSYQPKDPQQRKKVLSIRPYASATYGNDLSVRAIQLLATKPWFSDMEFRMVGDGPLFEAVLEPLRQYPNVFIERRFLKRSEIATLHKQYGVFLSPTRMDTQGVSRDEAMSSGLVPVTNRVAAIPEFVDATCGMLAPGEDAQAMADGIAALYESPELFSEMSANASRRVAGQSAKNIIVHAEIGLLE